MALHLHRAADTDELADALAELLAVPLPDPLAQDVVVVPEHGIERWLAQRLSHRLGASGGSGASGAAGAVGAGGATGDGVCAGVRFVRPASLVTMLTRREDDDPWLPTQLVWPLLSVMDASLGEPWCAALTRHLAGAPGAVPDEDESRNGRRYSTALRLARLFHRYGEQRPALLSAWHAGRDEDGAGGPLAEDLRWQAELYRRLAAAVPAPPPDERHSATLARLAQGEADLDLPDRLSLFGHTRLPVTEMDLLRALAQHRDVHLFLPQPSPAAWDRLAARSPGIVPREEDHTAAVIAHPLLASLGRDSRELVRVVAPPPAEEAAAAGAAPHRARPDTLLGWLQRDLAADRLPTPEERAARRPHPTDRSLSIHACHGPDRQVEVLREVLVGLMEDDPTLEPRDILVMCPDVETYAPLIGAAFGLGGQGVDGQGGDTHPAHRLRVQLADRGLAATNPLLDLAERLVALPGARHTAKEVLDLLSLPPVRRRFRLDEEDIATVHDWVATAGIRWGLDAAARAPYRLDEFQENTWRFGLDRLLAGVAVSQDGPLLVGPALPVDDVGSGSIDLVGALAEFQARLTSALAAMDQAGTARAWADALGAAVRSLGEVPPREAWQLDHVDRTLGDLARHAPDDVPVRLGDARILLRDRLAPRPTQTSFRTGALTVCTMVPMRSVPHRVICLLGLDDGAFPRQPAVDGDDVLARRPLTGERDTRSEDRQLLLDALMAARDAVVLTFAGADPLTGATLPPAVPVGELHDAARRTVAKDAPEEVLAVRHHPLQPFDARNFTATATDRDRPFSFDTAALAGALASAGAQTPPPPLLATALPGAPVQEVGLADLVDLLTHPGRALLRDRLGITLPAREDALRERMPVELDDLDLWAIGDRVLNALVEGRDPQQVWVAELRRGALPPGPLAQHTLRPVVPRLQGLLDTLRRRGLLGAARTVPVAVSLPGGRRLTGAVPGVVDGGVRDVSFSAPGAKPQLRAWVRLLALTAAAPQEPVLKARAPQAPALKAPGGQARAPQAPAPQPDPPTAWVLGSSRKGATVWALGPVEPGRARDLLADLADLLDLGRTVALPLPAKTGAAWAEAMGSSGANAANRRGKAEAASRRAWEGGTFPGEAEDRWWQRLYGEAAPLAVLLRDAAGPGTDLPALAERVWAPLLAHRREAS